MTGLSAPHEGHTRLTAVLNERACALGKRSLPTRDNGRKFSALAARAGNDIYGVDLQRLAGIATARSFAPVGRGPRELIGLTSIRGEIWSAFDFQALLSLETSGPATGKFLLLLRHARRRIALCFDDVLSLRTFNLDHLSTPTSRSRAILAATREGIALVDVDKLWAHPALAKARPHEA